MEIDVDPPTKGSGTDHGYAVEVSSSKPIHLPFATDRMRGDQMGLFLVGVDWREVPLAVIPEGAPFKGIAPTARLFSIQPHTTLVTFEGAQALAWALLAHYGGWDGHPTLKVRIVEHQYAYSYTLTRKSVGAPLSLEALITSQREVRARPHESARDEAADLAGG